MFLWTVLDFGKLILQTGDTSKGAEQLFMSFVQLILKLLAELDHLLLVVVHEVVQLLPHEVGDGVAVDLGWHGRTCFRIFCLFTSLKVTRFRTVHLTIYFHLYLGMQILGQVTGRHTNNEGAKVFTSWLRGIDRAYIHITERAGGQAKTSASLDVILLPSFNLL